MVSALVERKGVSTNDAAITFFVPYARGSACGIVGIEGFCTVGERITQHFTVIIIYVGSYLSCPIRYFGYAVFVIVSGGNGLSVRLCQ